MAFLQLPLEIRLRIYTEVFGHGISVVDGGRQDVGVEAESPAMLPISTGLPRRNGRSAQFLRTCKTILAEARPVLYQSTTFRVSYDAFAGRLPAQMTHENPTFAHVRHLEWTLNCDILKHYDEKDVHISTEDVRGLQSLQVTCQAECWKGSFCGEWCDREVFVRGRQQLVNFSKLLQARMNDLSDTVTLVEDTRYLGRGRVVLRLRKGRRKVGPNDVIVV